MPEKQAEAQAEALRNMLAEQVKTQTQAPPLYCGGFG